MRLPIVKSCRNWSLILRIKVIMHKTTYVDTATILEYRFLRRHQCRSTYYVINSLPLRQFRRPKGENTCGRKNRLTFVVASKLIACKKYANILIHIDIQIQARLFKRLLTYSHNFINRTPMCPSYISRISFQFNSIDKVPTRHDEICAESRRTRRDSSGRRRPLG
jgi:hypothetical protein